MNLSNFLMETDQKFLDMTWVLTKINTIHLNVDKMKLRIKSNMSTLFSQENMQTTEEATFVSTPKSESSKTF